jgi:hypothetical protein
MVGTTGAGGLGACTLLGPEGPDNPLTLFRRCGGDGFSHAFTEIDPVGWWVWGFWPSVENYIVDASILDSTFSDVGSQKVNRQVGCLSGCPCLAFTGQFLIRAFGFGWTNSIELM